MEETKKDSLLELVFSTAGLLYAWKSVQKICAKKKLACCKIRKDIVRMFYNSSGLVCRTGYILLGDFFWKLYAVCRYVPDLYIYIRDLVDMYKMPRRKSEYLPQFSLRTRLGWVASFLTGHFFTDRKAVWAQVQDAGVTMRDLWMILRFAPRKDDFELALAFLHVPHKYKSPPVFYLQRIYWEKGIINQCSCGEFFRKKSINYFDYVELLLGYWLAEQNVSVSAININQARKSIEISVLRKMFDFNFGEGEVFALKRLVETRNLDLFRRSLAMMRNMRGLYPEDVALQQIIFSPKPILIDCVNKIRNQKFFDFESVFAFKIVMENNKDEEFDFWACNVVKELFGFLGGFAIKDDRWYFLHVIANNSNSVEAKRWAFLGLNEYVKKDFLPAIKTLPDWIGDVAESGISQDEAQFCLLDGLAFAKTNGFVLEFFEKIFRIVRCNKANIFAESFIADLFAALKNALGSLADDFDELSRSLNEGEAKKVLKRKKMQLLEYFGTAATWVPAEQALEVISLSEKFVLTLSEKTQNDARAKILFMPIFFQQPRALLPSLAKRLMSLGGSISQLEAIVDLVGGILFEPNEKESAVALKAAKALLSKDPSKFWDKFSPDFWINLQYWPELHSQAVSVYRNVLKSKEEVKTSVCDEKVFSQPQIEMLAGFGS